MRCGPGSQGVALGYLIQALQAYLRLCHFDANVVDASRQPPGRQVKPRNPPDSSVNPKDQDGDVDVRYTPVLKIPKELLEIRDPG